MPRRYRSCKNHYKIHNSIFASVSDFYQTARVDTEGEYIKTCGEEEIQLNACLTSVLDTALWRNLPLAGFVHYERTSMENWV